MTTYSLVKSKTGEVMLQVDAKRLETLQAASERARRRDFDVRYGNSHRPPSGTLRQPKHHATGRRCRKPKLGIRRTHKSDNPDWRGPATELKVIGAESVKQGRDYVKKRAAELGGQVAEVHMLEEVK